MDTLLPWFAQVASQLRLTLAFIILGNSFCLTCVAGGTELFSTQLETIRNEQHVPAIAAAAMRGGELIEIAATGVRRVDRAEKVTIDDQWHVGSCTKSMTATLAAILVERGEIEWQTTLGEVFPESRAIMNPAWVSVTLEQLLSHRGGAPGHPPEDIWREAEQFKLLNPSEQRRAFAKLLMERPPEFIPGRRFSYSDDGYAIAGAMLERRTRKSWEALMQDELFTPLEMTSAGFGAPGKPNAINQPWGHWGETDALAPVQPGPSADYPPALAPGATVHCSIGDLVRYAAWHARAGRSPTVSLIDPKSFEMLHAPARQDYALGWSVLNKEWAGGRMLMHTGSNMYWYAEMWVLPERDAAFVAATNCYCPEACEKAIEAMVERVLGVRPD